MKTEVPVLGFAAWSGTGKTTLLIKLLPLLKAYGLRIAVIKHAHHDFDIDIPGKDSYELRKAGADQMLVASSRRQALITETGAGTDPKLRDLIAQLDLTETDLVLVEGFRHEAYAKIECHRPKLNKDLIYPSDENIIAVASDENINTDGRPLLDLNDVEMIAQFIQTWHATDKART